MSKQITIRQYPVTIHGHTIGFVEGASTSVYDKKITDGSEWATYPDGSLRGDRTIGALHRTNPDGNDAHIFRSTHPEYSHLNDETAVVGIAPIFEGKVTV